MELCIKMKKIIYTNMCWLPYLRRVGSMYAQCELLKGIIHTQEYACKILDILPPSPHVGKGMAVSLQSLARAWQFICIIYKLRILWEVFGSL